MKNCALWMLKNISSTRLATVDFGGFSLKEEFIVCGINHKSFAFTWKIDEAWMELTKDWAMIFMTL